MNAGTRTLFAAGGALLALGCQGDGSDIGPRLDPLPDASCKVDVFDDAGRGVVGAVVAVAGSTARAVTGRNGRGDLLAHLDGSVLLSVAGAGAAAADGDLLGALTLRMPVAGGDLTMALWLPDVAASDTAELAVGTQVGAAQVDNPLDAGGVLTVGAGSSVGMPGGAAGLVLRTGVLQPVHLPGELPAGDALLFGRGVYVDPPEVTFTPGADLVVANDLLATGAVTLYRLDPATGEWAAVGGGIANAGLITATGAIAQGGLHAFATPVLAGAVRGRVVDGQGQALSEVLVSVDGRRTRSNDGVFTVAAVAAATADGAPRAAAIEVVAAGSFLPARATATVAMNGSAEVDAGDIVLDTTPCTNIRIQQITRARAEPWRPARISSLFEGVALATTSDDRGQVIFEDVPSRWFGFQDAYPEVSVGTYYAQGVGYAEGGQRWLDAFQFFDKLSWYVSSRSARVIATDAIGGGPLYGAIMVRGAVPSEGYFGTTRESGIVWAERSLEQRVTCNYVSERDGTHLVHAFTIVRPNGEHVEMPMQQVRRVPLAAFDRHGIVAGEMLGATAGRELRVRTTRRIERHEWWAQAFLGQAIDSRLPIDAVPTAADPAYRCGVDRAGGHVVVAEVSPAGAGVRLDGLAIAADVVPEEGAQRALDLPLDHIATAPFAAPGVMAADAGLPAAALGFDLALEQPSGRVVDVLQGIGGNHAVAGDDLTVTLPPLAGALAGHAWLVAFGGAATVGAATVTQRCLLRCDGVTAPTGVLLAPPAIVSPLPNAAVDSAGFTLQLQLPAGAQYGTIELRSESAGEVRLWQVVIPPETVEFAFVPMPTEGTSPVEPGRSYTLTVAAFAANDGPLASSEFPYRDLTTFWQSIGAGERAVEAVATVAVPISTF